MTKQKIQKVFDNLTKNKHIHECVLLVENSSGDVSYSFEYGGKTIDSPFLTASITKLYTTACIFILREQGKLSIDDTLTKYFDDDFLRNLHVYKGHDYSHKLTISHLLFHTSGLRDGIEEGNNKDKLDAFEYDMPVDFYEEIKKTKEKSPHFPPGMGKRAHYANINFDILGEIIEKVTDSPLEEVFKTFIIDPLGFKNTYLPSKDDDFIPSIYYKDMVLNRPNLIKSIRASGGCISTARELMVFIKAFFKGTLFNSAVFDEFNQNNRLQVAMMPIHYGAGYMRISLGGLTNLFMGSGELIGHSGSTGSLAFYYPEKDLFFVGDVNQMKSPAIPVRLAMRVAIASN